MVPMMPANADALWHVSGNVVDGEGHAIPNVTVTAYTETTIVTGLKGIYYTSMKTDDTGSFRVLLDHAKYLLYFDNAGYQSTSLEVDTTKSSDFYIALNYIVMKSGLSLVSVPASLQVHGGETVTVPFTFRNDGVAETVNVTSTVAGGYDVVILNQDKQSVESVYVPSGSTSTLSLEITAPLKANDTVVVTKIAGSLELNFSLGLRFVESVGGNVLTCSYPGRNLNPEDGFDYVVTLNNQFYYQKTYALTLSYPSGWNVVAKNEAGQKVSSVILAGQGSTTLHVTGTVPSNCTAGTYTIKLKESDGDTSNQLSLSTDVAAKTTTAEKQSLEIVSKYPSQSIQLGVKTDYPLTISMNGTKTLVSLTTEGVPDGWDVSFVTTDGRTVNSVLMDPNLAEDIDVKVTPSLSSSKGTYSFAVVASGGGVSGRLSLSAEVEGSYGISMSVDNLYLQASAQSTQTVTATVTNTGYSPLNNVALMVSHPDGWDAAISPLKVTTLAPNQAQTFTLAVTVPSGASPKDYLVTLKAGGDEASTAEQTIRVTVAVESSWTMWGIGLLIVAVAAFGLILTRMRRR